MMLVGLCGRPFTPRAPYISAGSRGLPEHACSGEPAGRPETRTQAAANHCGPQVTEHQVYIVVASAVCVYLSLSHTQSTSTCSAAAMPTADVRRRSLSSTTRRRTYSRRTAALWRLALALDAASTPPSSTASCSSLHCTARRQATFFSPLIEAHTCTSRQRQRERKTKMACIRVSKRRRLQMACTHPYVKHVSTVPYSCAADTATRAVVTARQRATHCTSCYVVLVFVREPLRTTTPTQHWRS
jgi:hypothetical protein